jgi:hypothetical protein
MKLTLTLPKPRNPLVAAAHGRRAGVHRRSVGGLRQQNKSALRRELMREPRSGP